MTREQIRQAADIVRETISAKAYATLIGIPVNRSGFCRCFIHAGDNDASMKLYDGRRGFHCFGCGASGDVVELAKRFYNLSFPQAIAKVAQDAGIPLPGTGQMTYDQARAVRAAADRKVELNRREAEADAVETAYLSALDTYLEAERTLVDITDPLYQAIQEANKQMFTDEEVAQAHREYEAHWKEVDERIRRGGKPVPPWKKPGYKPHPIKEVETGADVEYTPELIAAINARNNAKTVLDYLELRRIEA